MREIAEVLNMSKESICDVLKQNLDMIKLSARWVPCLLTLHHQRVRIKISNALLAHLGTIHPFFGADELM